ncbi:glyoxal oxidase [Geminicoccus flavidas]|uniref:glyoxal oxidase n=1 Tax=Geminicoccus flavidas TaxID=2506407 RepID=UPI0013590E8D|nr:glyoxal oxidase [Geminicoccus flavidas]
MSFGTNNTGKQTGYFIYDVWDPNDGVLGYHLTLPNGTSTDLFCSAQILLPGGGSMLIAGGDNWDGSKTLNTGSKRSNIFRSDSNDLVPGRSMYRARWYATLTTLPNGETFIQGGDYGTDHPEIRNRQGSFRLLNGADTSPYYYYYPRNWVAPDGFIFGFSESRMYKIDPRGAGKVIDLGVLPGSFSVTSTEAMYAPGKILRVGGGKYQTVSEKRAVIIDINGEKPEVSFTQSPPQALQWSTATVLADGQVVVTGGSSVRNELQGVNTNALIWDPGTGGWTTGAASNSSLARLYHSGALLLPDASVLVGGGGAPGPQRNLNAEIYYPPYLFDLAGNKAVRPKIEKAPLSLSVGRNFILGVNNGANISRVTLVKTGSVTHSTNMEQRFLDLPFKRSSNTLQVTAPTSNRIATPGYYLLFVIDRDGVPSVGKVLAMHVTAQ